MKKLLLIAGMLLLVTSVDAQKTKLYGNRYLKGESKTAHLLQLNAGYHHIRGNEVNLYGNVQGFPLGIAYEIDKNDFLYGKLKYINFALESADVTGMLYDVHYPLGTSYHTTGSFSQHLIAATFGIINSKLTDHHFQAGVSLGVLATMESEKIQMTLPDGSQKNESYDGSSGDVYLGFDLGYKFFVTPNLFLGAEIDAGYLMDYDDFIYSFSAAVGWRFTKKKNYRF